MIWSLAIDEIYDVIVVRVASVQFNVVFFAVKAGTMPSQFCAIHPPSFPHSKSAVQWLVVLSIQAVNFISTR
eukprot:SAG31_NODE_4792_length_2954_cov_1.279159_3_plen_72_part_00